LKFIHGFAEEIPFIDKYFDVILLGDIIEHFRNPTVGLNECLRVVKKGLIICVPIKEEVSEEHINPFNVEKILSLLDQFALKITFFNIYGVSISKDEAISKLKTFPWLLIRAEKSEKTDEILKWYVSFFLSNFEKKIQEELLSKDQWEKGNFHNRDHTEISRFDLVTHLIEGNEVLEIGSGNGDSTIVLSKTKCHVIGIDISKTGIIEAQTFAKQNNLDNNPTFAFMSGSSLAFKDNSFDTVILPEIIEHLKSPRRIIQEAIRVVRNGGRIIISVPDGLMVPWEGHLRIFFKDTLTTELDQYTKEITWHELPFKKWMICSFFVRKSEFQIASGPQIDILMPTYNGKKTIERAIKSIINQTYENWNLIVVNDGGEDLQEVIENLNDPRIKYIVTDHYGKSHALNVGIKNSHGKYISYLDDDDLLYPIHLEELIKSAENERKEFVYVDWYEVSFNEQGKEFQRIVEFREDVTPEMLITQNYINHKCILHSRELLSKTGLYDESLDFLIDWDIIRRLAFQVKPFHIWSFTSERICYYEKNILQNRISGLGKTDKEKVCGSIKKIIHKTKELHASTDELHAALENSMINFSYFHNIFVSELNCNLQTKNNQILEITNQVTNLNLLIAEKDLHITKLFEQISILIDINTILKDENSSFKGSISNQLLTKFHKNIIERALPQTTRRRKIYDLALKRARILFNEE
jgi:glycosyltransferase involved in cell wall biosynthesis/ubiquinone/menaquinone biosynthesis C-methylase UbiE